ncbi:MAG: S8 family peptidase, partial [Ruminiclostridium sp.]
DRGISNDINLPWVNKIECSGIGNALSDAKNHGTDVTSAFLFGPIDPVNNVTRPFCNVDNIRVVDSTTGQNGDFMYYDVLDRILKEIDDAKKNENPYEYINLSIGPDIPIEDNDITRWTVELDKRLSGGKMLACVAAGNNGEEDENMQLNRIQPPSDGVNVLAVGASDRSDNLWNRASYSCVGPGRCPGFIKPDGIAFGGTETRPFLTLDSSLNKDSYFISGTMGTSFASPYALRSATAIKVMIGDDFIPLSVKALMVHRADQKHYDKREVGWGSFEMDISRLITCDDDEALVIFQGILPIKETLRVPVPMPNDALEGMISITATLVIAPEVDASFPNTYTRAGLTVAFRPDCNKFNENEGKMSKHPKTKSFFSESIFSNKTSEYLLRTENHKWETCLKETKTFRSTTLNKPCFDVYYNNRIEGGKDEKAESIPYSLIVSIKAPKVKDLYNKTVRTYINQLVPLKPKTRIQVNV